MAEERILLCFVLNREPEGGRRQESEGILFGAIGRWSGVEQGSCRLPCFAATPGTVKSFVEQPGELTL